MWPLLAPSVPIEGSRRIQLPRRCADPHDLVNLAIHIPSAPLFLYSRNFKRVSEVSAMAGQRQDDSHSCLGSPCHKPCRAKKRRRAKLHQVAQVQCITWNISRLARLLYSLNDVVPTLRLRYQKHYAQGRDVVLLALGACAMTSIDQQELLVRLAEGRTTLDFRYIESAFTSDDRKWLLEESWWQIKTLESPKYRDPERESKRTLETLDQLKLKQD